MDKPPRKPPFTVTLSDEHRAALETLRVKRGLRSEAQVIRDLIDAATGKGLAAAEAQAFPAGVIEKAYEEAAERVGLFERKPFVQHLKPNKR